MYVAVLLLYRDPYLSQGKYPDQLSVDSLGTERWNGIKSKLPSLLSLIVHDHTRQSRILHSFCPSLPLCRHLGNARLLLDRLDIFSRLAQGAPEASAGAKIRLALRWRTAVSETQPSRQCLGAAASDLAVYADCARALLLEGGADQIWVEGAFCLRSGVVGSTAKELRRVIGRRNACNFRRFCRGGGCRVGRCRSRRLNRVLTLELGIY